MTAILYETILIEVDKIVEKDSAACNFVSNKYSNELTINLKDYHRKNIQKLLKTTSDTNSVLKKYKAITEKARSMAINNTNSLNYINNANMNNNFLTYLYTHITEMLPLEFEIHSEKIEKKSDSKYEFIPSEIVVKQDTVIKKIVMQINGCFNYEFYDAAMIMIRRLIENLIILNFLKRSMESEIKRKDESGLYLQLGGLIKKLIDIKEITLSTNTKKIIASSKELGDVAAHNPLTNLKEQDLANIQSKLRVLVEELIYNLDNIIKK